MDSIDSGSVIQALDAFDAAWQQQPTPPLEAYLPPTDHPSRRSILVGLVSIDMERRLKARHAVRTEDYLNRFPELRADEEQVLKLVLLEQRLRQQYGLGGGDDLLDRFPELAHLLTAPPFDTIPPISDSASIVREAVGLDLREYVLLEALGQGGMGEVYRSRDPGLGRDLALKVMRAKWQGNAVAESRFEQEARITGSLQHPGIVPVHNLGRLPDGRLYFTMKVVRGRTFADILHQAGERTAEQRAEDVGVFEKVCQTLAYAHSQRVIHRDLKPANVMVGAFGEVQVMDWGLAKVLPRQLKVTEKAQATAPASSVVVGMRSDDPAMHSRAGDVLGTYSYMAPEQACGAVEQLDERCDVFGLGAVLCEVLTGQPPYTGPTAPVLRDRAMRAELGPALARLEACGADKELVELAKCCLAVEPAERPCDAGEMARMVGAYFAGVQQRLREAEQKRVAAEARAAEAAARALEAAARVKAERRARRLMMGLAAALLLVVVAGGAAAWTVQQRRADERARQVQSVKEARGLLNRSSVLLEEGWQAHDLVKLKEATTEATRAVDVAQKGDTGTEIQEPAGVFLGTVTEHLRRAEKNRELMDALLDVWVPQEGQFVRNDASGGMMALAELSVDEQYAAAFRRWANLEIERTAAAEVVTRLQQEPAVVLREVIAALDVWMLYRLRQKQPAEARWQPLFRLAERLDHDERRRQVRLLVVGQAPPHVESLAGLVALRSPWLASWDLLRGNTWRRLQGLRGREDAAREPVLTVALLAGASSGVGDKAGAEQVLRQALATRPNEVVLLNVLGELLERQGSSRLEEAIGCYRAIRALRPPLGVALGRALNKAGRTLEAEAVLRDLLRQQPNNPEIHFYLGNALAAQKKLVEAATAFRKAIEIKPAYPVAYTNLGCALYDQKKLVEAERAFRKAIKLNPDFYLAYRNLGVILHDQKKLADAEATCLKAIELNPEYPEAYNNLGNALRDQKKLAQAEEAYRKAIQLKPDLSKAHYNLGLALRDQKKLAEAEAECRKAIQLQPDYPEAYNNLGLALHDQKKLAEAEAAFHKAIELKPDDYLAHYNLGNALRDQEKLLEAVAAYGKAIELKPDYTEAYNNLGLALRDQKKLPEAVAAFRKAIELQPDYYLAYLGLGNALHDQKRLADAEMAFRKAIQLKPDFHLAYYNLGIALAYQKKLADSEAVFRKVIELKPNYHEAYYNLGIVLRDQNKLIEAEEAYRKAIRIKPDKHEAYNNLGMVLHDQNKLEEAEKAYRRAIEIKPDKDEAHYNLGVVLHAQKKLTQAAAAFRRAIEIKPVFAQAHCNLGHVLRDQGEFAAALDSLRKGHALGVEQPGWPYPSGSWVRQCRRLVELDRRLPAILKGTDKPSSIAEHIEFAQLYTVKKLHAAAAQLYRDAFAADPKRAGTGPSADRYNAARAAAMAGCGQGKDADKLDDKQRRLLRQQALDWLRAERKGWSNTLAKGDAATIAAVRQQMEHWRTDDDLAGVRDRVALEKLPEDERKQWRQLWADVDALLRRAGGK